MPPLPDVNDTYHFFHCLKVYHPDSCYCCDAVHLIFGLIIWLLTSILLGLSIRRVNPFIFGFFGAICFTFSGLPPTAVRFSSLAFAFDSAGS